MKAEKNLTTLLQNLSPILQDGSYVFTSIQSMPGIPQKQILMQFREMEGLTLILEQAIADQYQLEYDFVAAWISLEVHSALDAVGLTATFSTHLAKAGISCNVVAGFYHDHIFVAKEDADQAIEILQRLKDL